MNIFYAYLCVVVAVLLIAVGANYFEIGVRLKRICAAAVLIVTFPIGFAMTFIWILIGEATFLRNPPTPTMRIDSSRTFTAQMEWFADYGLSVADALKWFLRGCPIDNP